MNTGENNNEGHEHSTAKPLPWSQKLTHVLGFSAAIIISFIVPLGIYSLFTTNQVIDKLTKAPLEVFEPQIVDVSDTSLQPVDNTKLEKIVADFAKLQPVDFSIYIHNFKTNHSVSYNSNVKQKSASLYKLFASLEVLHMIESDQKTLQSPAGNDTKRTIDSCIERAIVVSDNPCGVALAELVGWSKSNPSLKKQGFKNTELNFKPLTSAEDVGLFFTQLYRGNLELTAEHHQLLLTHLKNQTVNNRLSGGLPKDVIIAHKTGDISGYAHDAGIVYAGGDYVISVMSGPWSVSFVDTVYQPFRDLSKEVYEYFTSIENVL